MHPTIHSSQLFHRDPVKKKSKHTAVPSVSLAEHNCSQHSYSICYMIEATIKSLQLLTNLTPK